MKTDISKEAWLSTTEEICRSLKTDPKNGLSAHEAQKRLQIFGFNEIQEQEKTSILKLFINQLNNPPLLILMGALFIAGFLGDTGDALSIGVIVLFTIFIGFIQEYRAEMAIAALRKLIKPMAKIIREGALQTIPVRLIVPGDLVVLEAGDAVPADGRIIQVTGLTTQEAALTGESSSIVKITNAFQNDKLALGDRKNMAFMGTIVASGKGLMIVTQTAACTELGRIATMLQTAPEEETPLKIKLEQLVERLVWFCLIIVSIIFVLGFLRGRGLIDMTLIALSLAVAAVPEGLPVFTTIILALSMRKMTKHNAIIRHLQSVETLGCATVICTDKTGTLTQNKMVVRSIWTNNQSFTVAGEGYAPQGTFSLDSTIINPKDCSELITTLRVGTLCNNAVLRKTNNLWEIVGDPTEGALLVAAEKAGLKKEILETECTPVKENPFDSDRKRMSMLRSCPQGSTLFVKGATDIILNLSAKILLNGQEVALTEEHKKQIIKADNNFAQQALRVLAVAYRPVDQETQNILEEKLVFTGLLAMIDPPRPEVKPALEKCRTAGIRVVMITGDHQETAIAIARELGIIQNNLLAITGMELDQMSDSQLASKIQDIAVYARVSAGHKLRIVRAFKAAGEVVAVTGDGINDAPAIKSADLGIAMGISGTEVTKQASDMIITDDNFASIVNAVEEGRGIYDNIVKFATYLLPMNTAELLIIFIGTLFGFVGPEGHPFVSLIPIQLLWLNVVVESMPSLALSVDPLDPRAMERPPRNPKAPILSTSLFIQLFFLSILLAVAAVSACHFGLIKLESAELARTMHLRS